MKKKPPDAALNSQSARFLAAAKAAGVDTTGKKFEQAMGKMDLQKPEKKAKR